MSNVEKGFVPLPKVEQEQPAENILFELNLPSFVDQDRIGVHLRRIERQMSISGIKTLVVRGSGDVERGQDQVEVTGINPDGSALASKVKAGTRRKSSSSSRGYESDSPVGIYISTRQTNLEVSVKNGEIGDEISGRGRSLREVPEWSKELNMALGREIRARGTENLIRDTSWLEKTLLSFYVTFDLAIVQDPALFIRAMIIQNMFTRLLVFLREGKEGYFRHSLFFGPQLDRALILQALSRGQKIIKDLHSKDK